MFALEPLIVDRVAEVLGAAWAVKGYTTDKGDRRGDALASVMFAAGSVSDVKAGAVAVQPGWQVTLAVKAGPDAANSLDAAFSGVVEGLHNWEPGTAGGRRWGALSFVRFMPPQYPDAGYVGVEILFSTTGRFLGQE